MPPMIQETPKQQLINAWVGERGYSIASQRIEQLGRLLVENNPAFIDLDFSELKVLDIGCGGMNTPLIYSEHKFGSSALWEPWFLRIAWLLQAKVRDGIDVVMQPREDENNQIYNHITGNILKAFLDNIPLANLLGSAQTGYNLINCTNLIDPSNPSPYLLLQLRNLGLEDQKEVIILQMIKYVMEYAEYALDENGILALDKSMFIKRDGQLMLIAEA